MSDLDSIRVLDEASTILATGVSPRTWDRLRAKGDIPTITRLSERRIGFRLVDIEAWLDARRITAT
jgi:predicted DNA-binding transcriptional regulator AlpA